MKSLNRATLIGNLGNAPKITSFSNGGKAAQLSVATSQSWKDKSTGEYKTRTEWHRVIIYSERLVDYCEKYLSSGDRVFVEGTIETREWQDKNNEKRYTTEIILRPYSGEITLLSKSKNSNSSSEQNSPTLSSEDVFSNTEKHSTYYPQKNTSKKTPSFKTQNTFDYDDDIPF